VVVVSMVAAVSMGEAFVAANSVQCEGGHMFGRGGFHGGGFRGDRFGRDFRWWPFW